MKLHAPYGVTADHRRTTVRRDPRRGHDPVTVGGNRVNLLSWQVTEIASKDPMSEPFTVAEIGDHMRASMENWPRLLKPMEV